MKFKLEIDCDNAAFAGEPCFELGRTLTTAGERMELSARPYVDSDDLRGEGLPLRDINGNRVGRAWIEESE